jgi:hypothetical protein
VKWNWYRCEAPGGMSAQPTGCAKISPDYSRSATSGSDWDAWGRYYFVTADVGYYIRLKITIDNGFGEDTIYTPTTEQVFGEAGRAPVITSDPTIDSVPRAGSSVNASWGGWDAGFPSGSVAQSWYVCTEEGEAVDTLPADCTLRVRYYSYRPSLADVRGYLRLRIDINNVMGTATRISATSSMVLSYALIPPAIRSYPSIIFYGNQGDYTPGFSLYGYSGSWRRSPPILGKSYSWWQCQSPQDAGLEVGDCTILMSSASVSQTYAIRTTDAGRYIRRGWTALNRNGRTTAFSHTTPRIRAVSVYQPAKLLFFPNIVEDPFVGSQLWQDGGAWQAYGGMPGYYARVTNYRILWLACSSDGGESRQIPSDCMAISEASASGGYTPANEYIPRPSDVGYYLRVAITANSVGGPSTAVSAATAREDQKAGSLPTGGASSSAAK